MLSIWLCLMMVMSMLPTAAFAEEATGETVPEGQAKIGDTVYATLDEAMAAVGEGGTATIYLGEGTYNGNSAAPTEQGKGAGKNLTFVGAGIGETTWQIQATKQYGADGWCDYSFKGSDRITFENMTVVGSVYPDGSTKSNDTQGLTYINHITLKDCIFNGRADYWGYESTTFENVTFNAPGTEASGVTGGDYSLWTYTGKEYTFKNCTFNSKSGKIVNVYRHSNAGYEIVVNFEDCTVISSAPKKSVLNIKDSNNDYTINISGINKVTGLNPNAITCSRLFQVESVGTGNAHYATVSIDGTPVWKDGKMVSHAIDTANDKYTDGYKDNAFTDPIYSEWTKNPDGSQSREGTKTCKYCGQVVTFEETKEADPIEWYVSRSKTATALDTSTWTSNVTLSLPSAEEALASDVVFVLDKSTSTDLEDQALGMLTELKNQAASTKAKVKVGVVIFNKQANKTAPLTDLATGYDTIEAAINQEIKSGTNTHAGLLAGKKMLDEDNEVAANRKYLIFVSDGISYMYDTDGKIVPYYWRSDKSDNAPYYSYDPNSWSFKYGSNNPPESWSAWVAQTGNTIATENVTPILYADYKAAAKNGTLNINDYKNVTDLPVNQYTTCVDRALYYTYQTYAAAQEAGYNCYAVANGNSTVYPWGPAFMDYLAGGETVDFGKIQNDILYAVSAGSTVTDTIGEKFTFGGVDSFTLEVGKKEIKGVKDDSDENTVNFGKQKDDGKYPYTVTYTPDTKTFVWTINENVSNFAPVQLTYTVQLTNPKTDPGTYGVEDLKGEKTLSDAEAEKALFTNKSAVLNATNSAGAKLNPLDFPKPSLSYTVKKSSSGGSSGGGGGRKPTVTIPDDVPTGLNGDDHYAYIVGYPNGNVEPNGNITRAEVATIFFRLLTEEVRTANSTQSNSLSDVTRGQWFNHAVSTLSSMGIVKGHNDGTFAPNAPITRAEFAAIAARFDDKNTNTSSKFTDIASHWAKNEIGIAANKGWINGYPDGTFRPNQYITRAEAMTLVNRVLNRLPENSSDLLDSMIKWPDNSDASAWYYLAVQEATNSHYYKTKENKFEKWTELRETRDWTELEK